MKPTLPLALAFCVVLSAEPPAPKSKPAAKSAKKTSKKGKAHGRSPKT